MIIVNAKQADLLTQFKPRILPKLKYRNDQ